MKSSTRVRYRSPSILAALFCMGYVASLFLTYSFIVMPGLAGLEDMAFVAAFQGLETRFQDAGALAGYESPGYGNIPALIAFPGAILFSVIAAFLNWKTIHLKWIISAFILFLMGMAATLMYNLPANLEIFSAGNPSEIDAAQIRENFNERVWLYSNHFRAMTTTLATFCLSWVLYLMTKPTLTAAE